ncbi:MAG: SDR family oxidoreductase [Nitrospirae bacterium]|nr:SDR family oxidoreductase [Nitrospirota bacterium]
MRVLITGGFGYLGGRVAVKLAHEPSYIVRLGSRKAQVAPAWLPDAETVAMDVLEPASLSAAMRDVRAVIHLAAMNENECVANPGKSVLVNTLGTLNVLRAAIDEGVERFIYFSTAHVYGAPLAGEITELTLPRPIHPYAISHKGAEDYVLAAHDQERVRGVVVRLSNGFGMPTHPAVDRWTLLANDLCRQAVTTRRIILRTDGLQQRDFITLRDVGNAVAHLLDLPMQSVGNGVFNVGGDSSITVWDMANKIADRCHATLGYRPKLERPEPRPGGINSAELHYKIDKLKQTGFSLVGDLCDEIDMTLKLCKQAFGDA